MVSRSCPVCKKEFIPSKFKPSQKYCSQNCSQKKYKQSAKGKITQVKYNQSEKRKLIIKKYNQSEKRRVVLQRYNKSDKAKIASKKHRKTEKRKESVQKYLQTDKAKETFKKYRNSEKGRKIKNRNVAIRRKKDPIYKIKLNMRTRIGNFLKAKNLQKNNTTFSLVGCTPGFLKEHLEKQFYSHPETKEIMTWDNHNPDGWHIDHRIPLDSAKNEEDVIRLCHYTNLQPMWAEENLKKSNKLIYES